MSDYDPRRPSGSGPEPMDPSAGAPYHLQGPASYPADAVPSYLAEPYPGQSSATAPFPGSYSEQHPGPYSGPNPSPYPGPFPSQFDASPPGQYSAAYPTPGSSPYPQPGWGGSNPQLGWGGAYPQPGWGGPQRPGQVTGAAVLGYVEAGLLIISSLFVFAGASIVNDTASALSAGDGGITAQFVLAGMSNLIAAALFIAGGAMFTGANPTGRVLLVAAITLTAVTALFWVIRFHAGGIVVWAIAFLTMPAITACLAFGRSVNAWLQPPRPR